MHDEKFLRFSMIFLLILCAVLAVTACDDSDKEKATYTATFKADGETVKSLKFKEGQTSLKAPAVPKKPGYDGAWESHTLGAEDITINAVYTPIQYTATFKADGSSVGTVTFTVETSSITPSAVPEKVGYAGAWEIYSLGMDDVVVNAVYTPINYTVTFVASGETVATKTANVTTPVSTLLPKVPSKVGYNGSWEAFTLGTGDITVNAVYTPKIYTATFKAEGVVVKSVPFTIEDTEIEEPDVPIKDGYAGAWTHYELAPQNLYIEAVYTAAQFTVTFKADGNVVGTVGFNAGSTSVSKPLVPEKAGYDGAWESFTLAPQNIVVNAIYTPKEYTATFKDKDQVVGTVKFTVEDTELLEPTPPTKAGYTSAWESYTLTADNITVNPVYTPIVYTITYNFGTMENVANLNPTTYTVETATIILSDVRSTVSGLGFDGWYTDSTFTSEKVSEITKGTTGDITLYAKWVEGHEHTYAATVQLAPGILTEGIMKYTCSGCSDSYTDSIQPTRSIKLLAIGNSFSVDALEHLVGLLIDAGVENILIGNLYNGGCHLERHTDYIKNSTKGYDLYLSDTTTKRMVLQNTEENRVTMAEGLTYADWDIVTLQQQSGRSGKPESYDVYLDFVLDHIKEKCPNAEIWWHMTWANGPDYAGLETNGYGDQLTMYNRIVSTVQSVILTRNDISKVIVSGTAIQNLRTSTLGNDHTRDGFHLSYGTGRYTAAMMWLAALTGYDVNKITWTPDYDTSKTYDIKANLPYIKEAVANAVLNPYAITNSSAEITPEPKPDEPLVNATLSELTADDIAYLQGKGLDPSKYMLLDLTFFANQFYNSQYGSEPSTGTPTNNLNKFLCTQMFTRYELVAGTVIRVNSGYQYRPEGWIELSLKNTAQTRPQNVTTSHVVINDAWWGDFNYRGFNLSRTSGTIEASESSALRIYVPVAKTSELTSEDVAYLESLGLNPEEYAVLDYEYKYNTCYNSKSSANRATNNEANTNKFIGLQMFTRYDLTAGSVIRIEQGYQYRPEGWYDFDDKTTNDTRPANVNTESVIVSDAWWGDYAYRGFNFSKTSLAVLEESEISALRIYVKIA